MFHVTSYLRQTYVMLELQRKSGTRGGVLRLDVDITSGGGNSF
jgi:hypothetical protein